MALVQSDSDVEEIVAEGSDDETESEGTGDEGDVKEDSDAESGDESAEEPEDNSDEKNEDGSAEENEDESDEDSDDESDEDSDDDDAPVIKKSKPIKPEFPTNASGVMEKYNKLKGKRLFFLFPTKLPRTPDEFQKKIMALNKRIVKGIQPRQKSSRYCLVEFKSEEDRTLAMAELKNAVVDGKKLIVKIPKTDDEEFVQKIAANKAAKNMKNREKIKLKRAAKHDAKKKIFSSTVVVTNIPSSATAADVKEHFPDAVELRFTCAKGEENTSSATVTLPTPRDASNAYRKKIKIDENLLRVNFAISKENLEKIKQNKKAKKNKNKNKKENSEEPAKNKVEGSTNKRKRDVADSSEDKDESSPKKMQKQNSKGKNTNMKEMPVSPQNKKMPVLAQNKKMTVSPQNKNGKNVSNKKQQLFKNGKSPQKIGGAPKTGKFKNKNAINKKNQPVKFNKKQKA